MPDTLIEGDLLGRRTPAGRGGPVLLVVRCRAVGPAAGPAENATVLVDQTNVPHKARYISWINLYDIEHAARHEPGWELVDPVVAFSGSADWRPYGWGAPALPSVADVRGNPAGG